MAFNPNQPREPKGSPDGGQFAEGAVAGAAAGQLGKALSTQLAKAYGPVLAEGVQDGYVLRIHAGDRAYKPYRIDDPLRSFDGAGVKTYQDPSGKVVRGGKWMDWAEKHYPANYEKLTPRERAALEVEEQKKWGFKKDFNFHNDNPRKRKK